MFPYKLERNLRINEERVVIFVGIILALVFSGKPYAGLEKKRPFSNRDCGMISNIPYFYS